MNNHILTSTMSALVERPQQLNWLDSNIKLSSMLSISGLKGSGKSTLLRLWAQKNGTRAKWYTMHRFLPVPALLGFPQEPFESALEKASESWAQYRIIIWDDIHLLDAASRFLLFNFTRNAVSDSAHVFLSDEDHQEEFSFGFPHLKLEGFSPDEFKTYLGLIGKSLAAQESENLFKSTGGFPHLLFLWAQGVEAKKGLGFLSSLSEGASQLLHLLSYIQKPLSKEWLRKNLSEESAGLEELEKKNFLQETAEGFQIPEFIRDMILSGLPATEAQTAQARALELLKKVESTKPFEIFVSALAAQKQSLVQETLLKITISDFENLPQRDLHQLESWMLTAAEKMSGDPLWRLTRLRIHGLVLQGRRKDAVQVGLATITGDDSQEEESLWLKYEVVHWMNRLGMFSESQKILTDILNRVENPLKFLCKIEQSIPYVSLDPERALKGLLRVKEELPAQKTGREDSTIRAQLFFQIATAYNNIEELNSAAEFYLQAQGYYEEQGKIYFKAFCLFNRAWIALTQRNFEQLHEVLGELKLINSKFGYRYTQVGADLIEAVEQFLHVRLTESLHQLSLALATAKEVSAVQAQIDILFERARVLHFMGLENQARQDLADLSKIPAAKNSKLYKLLSLELKKDLSLEEFRDQFQSLGLKTAQDHVLCYFLERNVWPEELKDESLLKKTLRGQLALTQYRLLQAVESSNTTEIQLQLQELSQTLQKIKEPRPERVMKDCLEAQLSQVKERKTALLDRAEIELQIWNADPICKLPLLAMIRVLKDEVDLDADSQWLSARSQDRDRWRLWLLKKESTEKFQLMTLRGKQKLEDLLPEHPKNALVIVEHLGKVMKGTKEIEDFHRRPILRQMISLLLEIYPSYLTKASLASAVWGDTYSPEIHDSRIYTSIQRLRSLLGETLIENWEGGYRWNPNHEFFHYKPLMVEEVGGHKIKVLILETLRKAKQSGRSYLGRAELVEASGSSESTVKRVLSQLLQEGKIDRQGKGPAVTYSLK